MSAVLANDGVIPVNALYTWTDGRWAFAAIPGSHGNPPCIFKFALSEEGLWKIMHLLKKHNYEYDGPPMLPVMAAPVSKAQTLLNKFDKEHGRR
jgi:hypothetical protein